MKRSVSGVSILFRGGTCEALLSDIRSSGSEKGMSGEIAVDGDRVQPGSGGRMIIQGSRALAFPLSTLGQ